MEYDETSLVKDLNLLDVARKIGLEINDNKPGDPNGNHWQVKCPYHNDRNFGSTFLYVSNNEEWKGLTCFACGEKKHIIQLVADQLNVPRWKAREIIAEDLGGLKQYEIDGTENTWEKNYKAHKFHLNSSLNNNIKNKTVEEIKTNAYIENAKISRKLPNKIELNIEEREATYNVEFLNGYAYINNQGYILEKTEQKIEKPVIRGISTEQEQIVEGNRLNDDDLEKLETVIQIMNICKSYELDTKVSSIDVTSKNDYILEMDEEKKTVHLGNDSNLNNKMLYVPAILTENKGKEGTIYLNGDINNNFKPRFREKV